ncbi:hypothetical protein MC7420_3301 [Coleofasciculus chthonoplastes PCC 7420]|uniref:Uncharacterized protein n=1 Tax=Coleofasciculus chthonoplastes PCC 7420 TaxID=118168 RepID=B4VYV3_9CYAN|nr:hypothetical protein MC7420_3301 [Coleofasciculus chthonoplastes PCC 7420]
MQFYSCNPENRSQSLVRAGLVIAVDTSIRTFGTIVETRHGASLHK